MRQLSSYIVAVVAREREHHMDGSDKNLKAATETVQSPTTMILGRQLHALHGSRMKPGFAARLQHHKRSDREGSRH